MFKLFSFRRAEPASPAFASICGSQDAEALAKLGRVLKEVGAELVDHYESDLGVNRWTYHVGRDDLVVFSDFDSVDLEGPPDVVNRVATRFREA